MQFFATLVAVPVLIAAVPYNGHRNGPPGPDHDPGGHDRQTVPMSALGLQTAPRPAAGTWSKKARLGEARTEAAVAFLNRKLYVLGGMARGQESHTLKQACDPAADRWRERAPMPHALSHPGAVAMSGKIYVVDGFLRNAHLDAQDLVFELP